MRKTKIVGTIGPASNSRKVFEAMCKAGLNVARLNFSHGAHEEHKAIIDMIKSVREDLNIPVAIMLDTKGPEYRIGTFKNGKAFVKTGEMFTFTTDEVEGTEGKVSVSYKGLRDEIEIKDRILVNNGLVVFEVECLHGNDIMCRVITGGELSNRKSMSFPNKVLKQVYLSEQDKKDILFGIENGVDFIAASFVSCKQDMVDLKNFVCENGGSDIDIIAKIENRAGVDNIEEICEVCDGIMVARGDLGVEVPYFELPAIQKYLITKCRMLGKRVITATEMLESMTYNIRPTRAEISDVANAVYDGSSAVMLSGESAAGKYPVETVEAMSNILAETERHYPYEANFRATHFEIKNKVDAISHATCTMAVDVKAKGIVVTSMSGKTVRMVSRFRCPAPILGMATNKKVWYKLALSWGVLPILSEQFNSTDVLFYHALKEAKEKFGLNTGDTVVMTGGSVNAMEGTTNTIKVETL